MRRACGCRLCHAALGLNLLFLLLLSLQLLHFCLEPHDLHLHTSAYVSICQHTSGYLSGRGAELHLQLHLQRAPFKFQIPPHNHPLLERCWIFRISIKITRYQKKTAPKKKPSGAEYPSLSLSFSLSLSLSLSLTHSLSLSTRTPGTCALRSAGCCESPTSV